MKRNSIICNHSHLTLEERKIIQTGIENRAKKSDIAKTLGKDPTTIAKEIKKHRQLRPRNVFIAPSICIHNKKCGGCKKKCSDYQEQTCTQRDRSPGACNKCPNINKCRLDKYFYYANKADEEYHYTLVDSREGINLTTTQRKEIASIIVPLLKQGQSLYQILSKHNEISQSDKTIYNYIDMGVFKEFGITNLSLKEKVQRKQFKSKYKKRKEPVNYDGRRYSDYLKFITENPYIPTVEMDTVYNKQEGPYIQTFIFENTSFMIGFLHTEKTSLSMSKTLDYLQEKFAGTELYNKLFSLLLTDRGSEFEKYKLFEMNISTGEIRSNIFYCDPMQSSQKPHVENNHNYIRDIIPNGVSIEKITQNDLNLMFSHINSTPRKIYDGKTPYEMFEFIYKKETIDLLNIQKIERDKVILKPYLLKHIYK